MGFWSGIKHTLNSTLGTEDFEPLDKIIKQTKTLRVSDNLYQVISTKEISTGGNMNPVYKDLFVVKVFGTFKLKFIANVSTGIGGEITIYKNNEALEKIVIQPNSIPLEYFSNIIQVNPKDLISVSIQQTSYSGVKSARIEEVDIYADLFDGSGISIV